jgi:CheY-like chemotaxis protein
VAATAEGEHVRFSVRDHGPGIDDALRARLFQPFVQGESPLVKRHQGTGLGLAICRRLVEMHGGNLAVDSRPGEGATFHFTLPVAGGPTARNAHKVVFLVDEGSAATRELSGWLEAEGYRVVGIASGADAWELAARTRPAAIVLDPSIENHDAFQLLDELKRRKATCSIPVVVSSSPAAVEFLPKPFERGSLLAAVADTAAPGLDGAPPLVLSIDDDPQVSTVLRAILEPAGYRLIAAERATEGIRLAQSERPAVILVDLTMPEMTGLEVVDALALDERTREVPVVVLTAAELGGADRQRVASGVRDVVEKGSATRAQLLDAIRRATAGKGSVTGSVVLIDDNELNRELARALLERRGWRVLLADSGERGVAMVRSERPALVVCDLAMPGMDGFSVARTLKAEPGTAGIPLLAVTALAMRGDEQRAYAAGFDAYLTKPIDRRALDAVLAALPHASAPYRAA